MLERLKDLNHSDQITKRRRYRHHQFLSPKIGQPDLEKHLLQLIALMRASNSWKGFMRLVDNAFPKDEFRQLDLGIE